MPWAYNYRSPNQMSFGRINAPSPTQQSFGRMPGYTAYQLRPSIWQNGPTQNDVWAEYYRQQALRRQAPPAPAPMPAPPQVPAMQPMRLPLPYPRPVVSDAMNQVRAQAAQAANLPYLMKQYGHPGVSYSAATKAMAIPEAISTLSEAQEKLGSLALAANQANAAQRLAGGTLAFNLALARAREQAALDEMLRDFNRQRQAYAIDAMLSGPDPWALL